MRPISLELEAFRSFRTRRTIAFGSPRLFAILGDTGAGKSSILEAITYALFNRSTWSGRNVKELIAKGARAMSATFRFAVGGEEYVIERITRATGQPTQRLRRVSRPGLDVATQREVDAAVRELLRIDDETFLHTVLLPQGLHAELLMKDPGRRDKILAELFQLDALALVGARAKGLEARADGLLLGLRAERAALGGDPTVSAADAVEAQRRASERLARAEEATREARAIDEQIVVSETALCERSKRATALQGVEALLDEFARLEEALREHDGLIAVEEAALEAAQRDRDAAQATLAALTASGYDGAALRERARVLDAIEVAWAELARNRTSFAEGESNVAATQEELRAAQLTAQQTASGTKAARDAQQRTEDELGAARRCLDALAAAIGAWDAAAQTFADAQAQYAAKTDAVAELDRRSAGATEAAAQVAAAWRAAQDALELTRMRDRVAAIAVYLHAGEPCPVCERPLPADFAPPPSPDLDAAMRAERDARAGTDRHATAVQALQREIARAQGVQTETARAVEAAECAERDAVAAAHAQVAGGDPRAAAAAVRTEIARLELALAELRADAERASGAQSDAQRRETTLRERLAGQIARRDEAAAELRRWQALLEDQIAELPAAERAGPAAGELGEARRALAGKLEHAAAAEARPERGAAAVAATTTRRGALVAERAERFVAPRARAVGRIGVTAAALGLAEAPRDDGAVDAWVREVVAAAVGERARCKADAAAAMIRRDTAVAQRRALVERLGDEPASARTAALLECQRAEDRLAAANAQIARAATLDERIARLSPAKAGLAQLRDALGARDFRAHATMQRQRRLLEVASTILLQMREQRYEFTADFAILDHWTNEVRPPQTLCGGEKFLASLALSLAAVEIAASAGAKIEALFLDEGFDALDAATLPDAMMELAKWARTGRMICVITHLSEAAQFVNDAMLVRPTADGSEVVPIEGPMDDDQAAAEGLVSRMAS